MASSEPCSTPAAAGAAAWTQGLPSAARAASYGVFALPLAFAALPLYVQWPAHAAGTWGLPLALVGALLLGVRVFDAFVDPWIGARVDRLFARSFRLAWAAAGAAAACIALGVAALMFAPPEVAASQAALLAWAGAALVVTSLGYSVAMVTHQAWAVRLGGGTAEQARWVGAREALALVGVIVASVLPSAYGWSVTVGVLAVLLALAWLALGRVPPGARGDMAGAHPAEPGRRESDRSDRARSPWHDRGFRKLMSVVLVSGLASAIPASLVVLYVRDVLQAGSAAEGWVLGLYFAAAALGMPLWVRVIRRHGLVRPWLAGMVLSVAAFAGAATLGPGEAPLFALVCVASGLALGADLVAPPALLAALIRQRARLRGAAGEPHTGEHEGVEGLWFGWWNFATKLTLAAAAGLALPLVQWLGYAPGDHSAASLAALAWCYALLPCAVKGVAAALLWIHRHGWPLDATGGENLADLRLS
jgi:Na+/melibiose symporter-like transporter